MLGQTCTREGLLGAAHPWAEARLEAEGGRLGAQPGLGAHLAVTCTRGAVNAGIDQIVLLSNRGSNRTWGRALLLDEEEAEAGARGSKGRSGGLARFGTPAKGGTEQDQGEAAERAAELGSWDAGEVAVRARRRARGRALLRGARLPCGLGAPSLLYPNRERGERLENR